MKQRFKADKLEPDSVHYSFRLFVELIHSVLMLFMLSL